MLAVSSGKKLKRKNIAYKNGYWPIFLTEFRIRAQKRFRCTINSVANCLFFAENFDFEKNVEKSLEILGNSINAERAVIWKNYCKEGQIRILRLAKWNNEKSIKINRHISDPVSDELSLAEILPDWGEIMAEQKAVYFIDRDMREPYRSIAAANGIRSVLVIPVFLNGNYWGFIDFVNYVTERFYTNIEKDLLRLGGILIASAIESNKNSRLPG
jgi:GAF domain-containing protein